MEKDSIPGIELLEPLRETSTAVTWKAKQTALSRIVAVKILKPDFADAAQQARLLQVARAVARIKHPNLIQIYDVVHHPPGPPYLIHEYVDGPSLGDILDRDGRIPVSKALTAAFAVSEAMSEVWRQARLVHRNLKPSEIRLDVDGTPKIADIGMAVFADTDLRQEGGMVVGTPNYLSPEQARGARHLDCRTDMYALGATLYHALTGQAPFADSSDPLTVLKRHLHDRLAHPRSIYPALPPDVCMLLQRLMMKAAADRYPDWESVSSEIRHLSTRKVPRAGLPPPEGLSTIGPPPATSATAQSAGAPGPKSASDDASTAPKAPPYLLRHTLWALLLVWLFLLARHRMREAAPPPAPTSDDQSVGGVAGTPEAVHPAAMTNRPHRSAPTVSTPQPPTPTPALPPTPLRQLAAALRNGDLIRAQTLAAAPAFQQAHAALDIAGIQQILADMPHPNELVEETLLAHLEREIEVEHNNRRHRLILRRKVNDVFFADILENDERIATRFTVAQLKPAERLRLAFRPRNPTEAAAYALLCLEAGDLENARRTAFQSGPLEPVVLEMLELAPSRHARHDR